MKKASLYVLVFGVVQVGVSLAGVAVLRHFFPDVDAQAPMPLLTMVAVASILLIVLFLALKWCPVSRNYIRTRPWLSLMWTALLGIGIVLPLTWLGEQLPEAWQENLLGEEFKEMLHSTEGYFIICMLGPLMEEIVFRGALIRALLEWCDKRMPDNRARWTAIVVSALVFSLVHCNPAQMPHAFVVGLLLGWLFVKSGSIVPGFIVHWINNSAAYVAVNLFPQLPVDAKLVDYFGGNNMAVAQAVISSLLIALPSLYQLIKKERI